MNSPLAWFGLTEDADEREIKRAYARRLKSLRPEDDAVAFQELHERYRLALAWRQGQPRLVEPVALATATDFSARHEAPRRDPAGEEPTGESPSRPAPRTPNAAADLGGTPPDDADVGRPAPRPAAPPAAPPAASPVQPPRAWSPRNAAPPAQTSRPQPGQEEPPPPRMLDPEQLADRFIAYARTCTPAQAFAWLNRRPELWSFETKSRTGALFVRALLREPQPIQAPNFDAALEFFGIEGAANRTDPLQLERLRAHMHERHQLQRRYQPEVQAWANSNAPDLDAVLDWFCELAWSDDQGRIAAALYAQPALNRAEVRDRLAPALLDRLLDHPPALTQEAVTLLLRHFGLTTLAARRGVDISDLPARLHVRWLVRPVNRSRLAAQIATQDQRPTPATAASLWRWASQPFRWWRVLLFSLVPNMPTRLGGALWRTCGGVPARLEGVADMRSVKFWIGAATRQHMTPARLQIAAWRCLLLLAVTAAATMHYWTQPDPPPGEIIMPLVFVGIGTLGYAYYLLHTTVSLWQRLPEQPATTRPRLRLAFIPLLCLAGMAVFAASVLVEGDDPVVANLHAHWIMLPTLVLSYQRYRGRSQAPQASPITRFGAYLFAIALFVILSIPLATAAVALGLWGWDLFRHRRQVQWRRAPQR